MYNVKTLKYLIICSIKYHQKILRISRNAVIQYWMPMIFEPITQKSKKTVRPEWDNDRRSKVLISRVPRCLHTEVEKAMRHSCHNFCVLLPSN